MSTWQVQQAKAHLSELLDDAETKGPQIITRHGAERAVVLSIREYRSLSTDSQKEPSAPRKPYADFKDWLLNGPRIDTFEIERELDTGRDFTFDD